MKVKIDFTQEELTDILREYIAEKGFSVDKGSLKIETKSKQNYRSEWEEAVWKASFEVDFI